MSFFITYITGFFGLVHPASSNSSPVSTSVSSTASTLSVPHLHSDYNTGTWTRNGAQIAFSMKGIVESSDGTFTAAGGTLGFCNISINNGIVKPNGTITFSIQQEADASTNCQALTADLHGTVSSDGSNPSGEWDGQIEGQPISGQWTLS